MNFETQIEKWVSEDSSRIHALEIASELKLNDWCLAAGFVRNMVWDKLHDRHFPTPLNDIDLIYFNREESSLETDQDLESILKTKLNKPWSVKNQARMHLRNKDASYTSTEDAMSYWVEVETAIGVRLSPTDGLELVAPFGLSSLFSSTVTINDKRRKPKEFYERVRSKKWLQTWPKLKIYA
ncbi:hypothetical protein C1752_03528 [Acaryochloris thomasi RCC1774]|uniref:Nitrate reductase n=1 Tax=Acaryochloris thomasi RCC1774 TaxID=1764569 RepID=A0A2W1JP82_9CYAN|nr:nucleotidyltransferase family protein [Acaryochloris thomasi]PZD72692.1 hypothetical protein C1752_03528 [Acaryochloris thomasi RCC1774]